MAFRARHESWVVVRNRDVAPGGLGGNGEPGCGTGNQTSWVAVGNWGVTLVGTRQEGWVVVWNWGVALGTRHDSWVVVGNRDVALGTRQVGW